MSWSINEKASRARRTMLRGAAGAMVVATAFGAAACGSDDDGVEPVVSCTTTSGVLLNATAGLTPQFSWTPSCSAAGLFVQRVADGAAMWSVQTTTNPLTSPITYATTPPNSTATAAAALVATVQYRVGIVNSAGATIATKLFTP